MVEYIGKYVVVDASVIEAEKEEWKTTLKSMRDTIKNNLLAKIPTETEFINKIAEASHEVYKDFVNPNYPDSTFILLKHKVKLQGAYSAWDTGVKNAFAEGGAFDLGVEGKANKWLKARYVIGSTGLRWKIGWKVSYKAIGTITGDKRVLRYADPNDSWVPSPQVVNVFLPGAAKFVRPQAMAILTQGLVLARYALDAGDTSTADAIISEINNRLNNTVKKQIDTANYPNADIFIERSDSDLYVHAKSE